MRAAAITRRTRYGDVSEDALNDVSEHYAGIIAIPSHDSDSIPDHPCHFETMTVKAPILAEMQKIEREGFKEFVRTFEGGVLVLKGLTGKAQNPSFHRRSCQGDNPYSFGENGKRFRHRPLRPAESPG